MKEPIALVSEPVRQFGKMTVLPTGHRTPAFRSITSRFADSAVLDICVRLTYTGDVNLSDTFRGLSRFLILRRTVNRVDLGLLRCDVLSLG